MDSMQARIFILSILFLEYLPASIWRIWMTSLIADRAA